MAQSYTLTSKQYNFLLPVFGLAGMFPRKILERGSKFFFMGTYADYLDALNRCKYLD